MNLLPPGRYRCLLHSLKRGHRRATLDFTELGSGERYVLGLTAYMDAMLGVALIRHGGSRKQVSGEQVELDVGVHIVGEQAFNFVKGVYPVDRLPGIETSVPTQLTTFDFEDMADWQGATR